MSHHDSPSALLTQIAARLKRRVQSARAPEYFAPERESLCGVSRTTPGELEAAMRLKSAWLEEFQGARLEDIYPAQVQQNDFGTFLHLTHREFVELRTFDPLFAESLITAELKLLYGVGPVLERAMKARGISRLSDLSHHPRWGREVQSILDWLQARDLKRLENQLARWLPRSHPLAMRLVHLVEPESLLFFDLESMGLFGHPIILLGIALPRDGAFEIYQLLARNITEELPAVVQAFEQLRSAKALVSYNGRAFDVNYVKDRLNYYGRPAPFDPVHFDLLAHARRRYREFLPDARLDTVEREILRRERSIDLPSLLVPDFYNTYLETQNIGPLIPILEHNKHDLLSLSLLFQKLCEP
jgi:hypothetical protein